MATTTTVFVQTGAGTNPILVDPERDIVAAVRWINGRAMNCLIEKLRGCEGVAAAPILKSCVSIWRPSFGSTGSHHPLRVIRTFLISPLSVLSLLTSACFMPKERSEASHRQSAMQSIRAAIGPSPWGMVGHFVVVEGVEYRFREAVPGDGNLSGLVSLQDASGAALLVLDFQCYARILDNGDVLLWREFRDKTVKRIVFHRFRLSALQPISRLRDTASDVRSRRVGAGPLPGTEHWELSSRMEAGVHSISIPHDWSQFEETLVLADHDAASDVDRMSRAVFAFDWETRCVEVFPQDWFNEGDYDFGYQWITRVHRRTDGRIEGDGIRLGQFELDAANRQVKRWIIKDPFYRIQ
jgi:hypothetical protein